jgi:hypothetical protein
VCWRDPDSKFFGENKNQAGRQTTNTHKKKKSNTQNFGEGRVLDQARARETRVPAFAHTDSSSSSSENAELAS